MNIFNYLLVCFREYLREHSRGYVTIHGTDKNHICICDRVKNY